MDNWLIKTKNMKKIIIAFILLLSTFVVKAQSSYPFINGYTPTTGDLLYYNGTQWVAIPAVAFVNGQALSGNGTGVAPSYKSLFGTLNGILMANGSGALSVGVAGTNYVSPAITIGGSLPLSGGGNLSSNRTLAITGLSTLGTANQIPGTNAGATAWEYKTLGGSGGITITHSAGAITIGTSGLVSTDNILSKTANYTVLTTDWAAGKTNILRIYVDATGGNVTITLPAASSLAGYSVYVTKKDASVNTVTIGTVLGSTTLVTQYQSLNYASDGTSWFNQ